MKKESQFWQGFTKQAGYSTQAKELWKKLVNTKSKVKPTDSYLDQYKKIEERVNMYKEFLKAKQGGS